ncbi:MAG: inositol monophosphatase family protein [Muricoprocola sp.]
MKEINYKQIEELVREAGKMMLKADFTGEIVHEKQGDANFCTDYDVAIQNFLIQHLAEILPGASFYGEEDTQGNKEQENLGDYVFYIDPIDGTTNFMFGYKHSCVSVGLAFQGKIIAGFVYNPFKDEMYTGILGQGSTLNGRRLKLQDKGLSEGIAGFDCTRYNEGTSDNIDILFKVVKELYFQSLAIREGGSSTLDLCRVASASNVVYFQMVLQPYDYAAAWIIVEEAGGVITQIDGSPLRLDGPSSAICGTPKAYAQTKEIADRMVKEVRG